MLIHHPPKEHARKEIKVNISVRHHAQLRTTGAREGRHIHWLVQEALDRYFASLRAPQD